MIERSNSAEELKGHLLEELASLKKQSVLALLFALIFLIIMVVLIFKLQESKRNETAAKEALKATNKQLDATNRELNSAKQQLALKYSDLDEWRISQLKVDSIPVTVEPIVVGYRDAYTAALEPMIVRPSMHTPPPPPMVSADMPQSSGSISRDKEDSYVRSSPPAAIRLPLEPMIAWQAQVQYQELKKQETIPETPFFGYIIYIQDAAKREASTDLQKILKQKGAIVPAIQSQNLKPDFGTSIKYFYQQDERNAQEVKKLLMGILRKNKIDVSANAVPVTYVTNPKVSLGQLEVWIGN